MLRLNRREFGSLALVGAAGLAASNRAAAHEGIHSIVRGVQIGAQSYSFRDRSAEECAKAMHDIGLGECELWSGHLERGPEGERRDREALRQWRLEAPLEEIEKVGKLFADQGIEIYALNYSFREDFTDAEIERGFEFAKALGAKALTASSNVSTAKRVDPYAKRYQMRVGMHNHSRIHENEFATPEDFDKAMEGTSDYIAINLDIGHFVAAGFDPVDYLRRRHDDIVTLHIKDRKKDQGPNMPFGEGDTPIDAVLDLLRNEKYRIPANIEYEYDGDDTIAEVRRCFEYCKQALES